MRLTPHVDHLVVAAADLDVGIAWVAERLGVAPVPGGSHEGLGTRNALLGLGGPYLEVLSLDPDQAGASSAFSQLVARFDVPALYTLAVAASPLDAAVPMSRALPDGTRLMWQLQFTDTPLFFIDWMQTPRPSGLPEGGALTRCSVQTPEPERLAGVADVDVTRGDWHIEAEISGRPLR